MCQLIDSTQELAKHLNDGEPVGAVVRDFSKAFDKVAHNPLLWKLEGYGVETSNALLDPPLRAGLVAMCGCGRETIRPGTSDLGITP